MWNKKRKEDEKLRPAAPGVWLPAPQEQTAPRKPTVLELLKQRRADRIEQRKRLDKEIEMLDHDITYVEVNPQGARVLEFIAARFNENSAQVDVRDRTEPWREMT